VPNAAFKKEMPQMGVMKAVRLAALRNDRGDRYVSSGERGGEEKLRKFFGDVVLASLSPHWFKRGYERGGKMTHIWRAATIVEST